MKVLIEDKNKPIHQIKRYVSECAALMRANHQFIIKFVGMTDMYPLTIVTAYVSHINLSKFLKKKCFLQYLCVPFYHLPHNLSCIEEN